MTPYADTNFLTRVYLEMPQSDAVLELETEARLRGAEPLPLTWLHPIELCNALQLRVFQGRDPAHLRVTPEQAAAAWAMFREDVDSQRRFQPASVSIADLTRQFEELSLRHTARHGFRTYDLMHVAFALLLECDTFWSFDAKASRLAALEGLK